MAYLILSLHYFMEFQNCIKNEITLKKMNIVKEMQKNKKEVIMNSIVFIRGQNEPTAKNLLSRLTL